MSFSLIVDPRAEGDLVAARADYDAKDVDIGRRFARAIHAFERIKQTPYLYPLVTDEVRFILTRRFPYVIYY